MTNTTSKDCHFTVRIERENLKLAISFLAKEGCATSATYCPDATA